jgi:hypothetical protein
MIETRLGDFEEVILLLVGILGEEAYAFNIADEFESQTARSVSIGAVHSTLTRLEAAAVGDADGDGNADTFRDAKHHPDRNADTLDLNDTDLDADPDAIGEPDTVGNPGGYGRPAAAGGRQRRGQPG